MFANAKRKPTFAIKKLIIQRTFRRKGGGRRGKVGGLNELSLAVFVG